MIEPQGERCWEAWREGNTVHQISGTGAKKPRVTEKEFPNPTAAEDDLQARFRKKFREGLVFRRSEDVDGRWSRTLMVHVSRLFTGFVSRDFFPQQNLIAIGRPDQTENQKACELVLIDGETGAQREIIPLKAFDLQQVWFAPQGETVYVRADGVVARVDLATHERTRLFASPPFTGVDFHLSRDGKRLLGSDHGRLVVRDIDTGADLLEVPLEEMRDYKQSRTAALSSSGNLVALCEEPGKIQLFDLATGERRVVTGSFPYVEQLLIHPSERYLILREHYADMGLWVIDAATGEELGRFPLMDTSPHIPQPKRKLCWHAALNADGTLLARGEGYDIVIHDFETGEEVARLHQDFAARDHSTEFTFAGTSDTLLSRVDLGIVSVYRHGPASSIQSGG